MFDVGDLPVLTFGNWALKAEWLSGLWNYMYVFLTFFYVFFKIQKTWLFTFFWVVAHVFPNSVSHLTKLILLPYLGNRQVQKSHARSQGTGGEGFDGFDPPQLEHRPTMVAIIQTRKGSRVVLNCCIERVSRVYCIPVLLCSIPGRTGECHPTAVVWPPYRLCSPGVTLFCPFNVDDVSACILVHGKFFLGT